MEEVRRVLAKVALTAFCFSSIVSVSRADICVSPRIKRAKSCGIVIDPYGMRIPNAKVEFGPIGSGQSAITDGQGKFSVDTSGREVHLMVGAPGFQSVETSIGKLSLAAPSCKKPLYVMLTIGEQGCAMVSMRKSELLLAKKD